MATSCCSCSRAARRDAGQLRGSGGRHRDEQSRPRARAAPSSASRFARAQVGDRHVLAHAARRSAARSAGRHPAISCVWTRRRPAMAWSAALQVLAVMKQTGASARRTRAPACPNIRRYCSTCRWRAASIPAGCPESRRRCAAVEQRLQGEGRIVLRASGTEPVIRVMVEATRGQQVRRGAERDRRRRVRGGARPQPAAYACGRRHCSYPAPRALIFAAFRSQERMVATGVASCVVRW